MLTVALIGPDGSGKTTVSSRLEDELGLPVVTIYMGVNMYASNVMLPHMRLIRSVRSFLHRNDVDATSDLPMFRPPPASWLGRLVASVRSALREANWMAEECYRVWVAHRHTRRGRLVIFDRHFFADFFASAVRPGNNSRPLGRRVHGFFLRRVLPRPNLVVFLDAPVEILYARKPEGSMERLAQKREECLAVRDAVSDFVIVDASRPAEEVVHEVATAIRSRYDRRLQERRTRRRRGSRPFARGAESEE